MKKFTDNLFSCKVLLHSLPVLLCSAALIAEAQIIHRSGFETLIDESPQSFLMDFPEDTLVGKNLVTGMEEAAVTSPSMEVQVPRDYYSFAYLVDAEDNVLGMSYAKPSQSETTIDATSTALALVVGVPADWPSIADSMDSYLLLIQAQSSFPALVSAVSSVMSSPTPTALLDDPNDDIYPALASVIFELYATANPDSPTGIFSQPTPPVTPYPQDKSRVNITNDRAAPFGISAVDADKRDCDISTGWKKSPYFVPGVDIIDDITSGEDNVIYPFMPGQHLLCVVKQREETYVLIEEQLVVVPRPVHPDLIRPEDLINLVRQEGTSVEAVIKADARLKGDMAHFLQLSIDLIGLIPGKGDAIAIAGPVIIEVANSNFGLNEFNVPWWTYIGGTGTVVVKRLETAYETRQVSKSMVRYLAGRIYGDSRKTRSIGIALKTGASVLGTIIGVGDVANILRLYASTKLPEHEACHLVTITGVDPPVIIPYDGSLNTVKCGENLLTVQKIHLRTGLTTLAGRVESTLNEIDCGDTCEASFAAGSQTTLSASSYGGFSFVKWADDSDVCAGSTQASCDVNMVADKNAKAVFHFSQEFSLGSKQTYLVTDPGDTKDPPLVINLGVWNIQAGDLITLRASGLFSNGIGSPDEWNWTGAVFSSLPSVVGAVPSGQNPYVTVPTCYSPPPLPTDIPEDFQILEETTVVVPENASYLIVGVADCAYWDNSDVNGDLKVTLER